jgi:hypothetical protein
MKRINYTLKITDFFGFPALSERISGYWIRQQIHPEGADTAP